METNPILGELTDADIAKLVSAGELRHIPTGIDIIREGVETPCLYILLSGKLSVSAGRPMKHLADLHPGELVGEMSFVDQRSSSAIVKAVEASDVLAIPRDEVELMIERDPAMGARFFRGIARLVVRRLRSTILHLGYNQMAATPEVQIDRRLLQSIARRQSAPAAVGAR
jgi:CRP/FNR family cyclic AMP-dependent transcriptional regulator